MFENIHEPIIDRELFDEVQRIRSEKHRVRELGDRPMLSGLLFCADCGKRMYQIRSKSRSHDQEYFECSTYRKGRGCSSHHIKNTEAIAALLDQIQAVSRFVKADENSFINRVAAQSKSSAEKDLKQNKRSLSLIEERILSLDQIIRQLYEDNLKGKITDQRFQKLSQDYENEQKELEQKVTCLKESISAARNTANNTAEFIKAVRNHHEVNELNAELLHELIERIEISDKKSSSKDIANRIRIIWKYIGEFVCPACLTQSSKGNG